MSHTRSALLGIGLALPLALGAGAAFAAQPDGGQFVYVPAGAVVLVVPQAAQPVDFPVARIMAEQQAMMRHMMAGMDALMATALPNPQQMIQSALDGAAPMGAGSGVIVRSFTSGSGTCSETITYGPGANGNLPVVKVSQTGDACGAVAPSAPVGAAVLAPTPVPVAPEQPVAPRQPKMWTIGNPPHPIVTGTPPRT